MVKNKKDTEKAKGVQYMMFENVGAFCVETEKRFNHSNLTNEVAEKLLKNTPSYADRIITVEEWERLGRPNFSQYQTILANGGELPEIEIEEVEEIEEEFNENENDENDGKNGD